MVGSVMMFEMETIEEVKKLIEGDIYYKTGVVRASHHISRVLYSESSFEVGSRAHCYLASCCTAAIVLSVGCDTYKTRNERAQLN